MNPHWAAIGQAPKSKSPQPIKHFQSQILIASSNINTDIHQQSDKKGSKPFLLQYFSNQSNKNSQKKSETPSSQKQIALSNNRFSPNPKNNPNDTSFAASINKQQNDANSIKLFDSKHSSPVSKHSPVKINIKLLKDTKELKNKMETLKKQYQVTKKDINKDLLLFRGQMSKALKQAQLKIRSISSKDNPEKTPSQTKIQAFCSKKKPISVSQGLLLKINEYVSKMNSEMSELDKHKQQLLNKLNK